MVTITEKGRILNLFCALYEGREEQIGNNPLVYGDLLLIAGEMGFPIEEVAGVLATELDKFLKESDGNRN